MSAPYTCRRSGHQCLVVAWLAWCPPCGRHHPVPRVHVPGPTPAPATICCRCWAQPCLCGHDGYAYQVLHNGRPRQRWAPGVAAAMGKSLAAIHDTRRQRWPHPAHLARGDVDPRAYMGSPADGVLGHRPMVENEP